MIRPARRNDIEQLARLHKRLGNSSDHSLEQVRAAYQTNFPQIFFDHPWDDDGCESLVSQQKDGRITGFVGVVPRDMSIQGRRVRMAVSSRLTVDPEYRSQLAGVKLLKTLLNGPQQITVADQANPSSQKIWEALGGITSLLYSLDWVRTLRPCEGLLAKLRERANLKPFAAVAAPFSRALDRMAANYAKSPYRLTESALQSEQLTPGQFLNHLPHFTQSSTLVPIYNHASVNWIWGRLANMWDSGDVHKLILKNGGDDVVGWYIYNLIPGAFGEVAQIAATENSIADVLTHLFHHAWQHGAIGLHGHVQPEFMRSLSEQSCHFHGHARCALVHSRDQDILQAFGQGNAFLTHLEGEGCLYLGMGTSAEANVSDDRIAPASEHDEAGELNIDRVQQLVAEAAE